MKRLVLAIAVMIALVQPCLAGMDEAVAAYDRRDYAAALKELRPLADKGDPEAQYLLATMYRRGEGVRKDMAIAGQWYRKAAEKGHVKAQVSLALMHIGGDGVKKDMAEAAKWLRMAAERGMPIAQLLLGGMLEKGDGVRKDQAEAASWYRKAADQGLPEAQFLVGHCYEQGKGVERNPAEALRWYRAAATQGYAEAQYVLGLMHATGRGVAQNHADAARWFRKAAEQGHPEGQFNLGVMYKRGEGVKQNDMTAARWYRRAADQGMPHALAGLGALYEEGAGVKQNNVSAHAYFSLAAAAFPPGPDRDRALRSRDQLARKLTQAQIAQSERMARAWKPKAEKADEEGGRRVAGRSGGGEPGERSRRRSGLMSTGTGFFVSSAGHVVTNHHVVDGCGKVQVRHSATTPGTVEVVARDRKNDLALLKTEAKPAAVASFRRDPAIRPGDGVVAVGFPLAGILAAEVNVTTGTVSALAGLRGDQRDLQMTTPVQPGNSGGPLLDLSGNVVGVVSSGLSARIVEVTGALPQNVNFAIKNAVTTGFLDASKVAYRAAPSAKKLEPADVGDIARKFTVLVECWK